MDISAIKALLQDEFTAVDALISRSLSSEVPLVNDIIQHIIQGGGKRLRPLVVLLSARACGYQGDAHILIAAIVEFIHTATLLHDDVVDRSALRRGRATAAQIWDNSAAVLVGDFLYSRSFQLMVQVGQLTVMDVLADASNRIAQGEVLQLMSLEDSSFSETQYRHVVDYKTATLFAAAAKLGACLAGHDSVSIQQLEAYGRHLGIAFQLRDDVLDYQADQTVLGKELGDDLAEGKPTLPLIYLLEHGSPAQKTQTRAALSSGDRSQFKALQEAVETSGGIAYTMAAGRQEVSSAKNALTHLSESPYKSAALFLADYAIDRPY